MEKQEERTSSHLSLVFLSFDPCVSFNMCLASWGPIWTTFGRNQSQAFPVRPIHPRTLAFIRKNIAKENLRKSD